MNDLYETMSTLRAVRRLRPDPIPDDVLERVLQASCWAPTGGNVQPWRVIVVRDPARKAKLQEIYKPEWFNYTAANRKRLEGLPLGADTDKLARTLGAGDYLADHLAEAPAILMFIADPKNMAITDIKLDRVSMIGGASVYTAVQNAMLACVAEGLGCTLTTLHCIREPQVQAALDIPESWATLAMVPIGYPVGKGHGPISRQPPSALAYDDSFGTPWGGDS
jgi:nitroreductase